MAVYLGSTGSVRLTRDSSKSWMDTLLDAPDVNVSQRRFSINFYSEKNDVGINYDRTEAEREQTDSLLQFISGDRVEIRTMPGEDGVRPPLALIPDWEGNSITRFVYVDQAGGMRLYNEFGDSLAGKIDNALELAQPDKPQYIELRTRNSSAPRFLAQCTEWEITTSRENIDTTRLGNRYRQMYENGIIQGQGRLTCLWEHEIKKCDPMVCSDTRLPELPIYLAQLILRLDQGADFVGQFYVYDDPGNDDQSVWYQADTCIVTNCVVSVGANAVVESTIEFVCSGRVMLRQGIQPDRILLDPNTTGVTRDAGFLLDEFNDEPVNQQQRADD